LRPYSIVFRNLQSSLCGIVAGLLFVPTTIGDMTWGVAFFQRDRMFSYHDAVVTGSLVPHRVVQEVTFDWLQTFWKSERYGALQYYTQNSYVSRTPWFNAPGAPRNAHLNMVYFGFRHVLPSTSGTLLRVPYPN
jgi:hypothetical protein